MMKKRSRYLWLIIDLYNGLIKYKYPICCVLQYSAEMFRSNKGSPKERQAFERNCEKEYKLRENPIKIKHIPCDQCFNKMQNAI